MVDGVLISSIVSHRMFEAVLLLRLELLASRNHARGHIGKMFLDSGELRGAGPLILREGIHHFLLDVLVPCLVDLRADGVGREQCI